jgi:RES domain
MANVTRVSPPSTGIYRLARGVNPFAPPDWEYANEDGTFGNRFDDPTANKGNPPEKRFRAIYCATQRLATFGETLARFRVSAKVLAGLDAIEDEESPNEALAGAIDPEDRTRGLVSADWRWKRRICHTMLDAATQYVDIGDHDTMQYLRIELAPLAAEYKIGDVDLSALTSQQRPFTQYSARQIYTLTDGHGNSLCAGIRFVSRLDSKWECWALFDDRFTHESGFPANIDADDVDLLTIARSFRLTVEVIPGTSYIRP